MNVTIIRLCSYKKHFMPLSRFTINDFGKPVAWCKDCMNEKQIERYHLKKLKREQLSTKRCTSRGEIKEIA